MTNNLKTTVTIGSKVKKTAVGTGNMLARFKTNQYALKKDAETYRGDHIGMTDREPVFGMMMETCKNTHVVQNKTVHELEDMNVLKKGTADVLYSKGIHMPDMVVTNAKGVNTIVCMDSAEFHFTSASKMMQTFNCLVELAAAKVKDGGKVVSVITGYQKAKDPKVKGFITKFKKLVEKNTEVEVLDFTFMENAVMNPTVMISKPSVAGVAEQIDNLCDCGDMLMEACGMADDKGFSATSFNKVLDILQYRFANYLGITLPELRQIAANMKEHNVTTVVGLQNTFGFKYKGQFALFSLGRNCKSMLDGVVNSNNAKAKEAKVRLAAVAAKVKAKSTIHKQVKASKVAGNRKNKAKKVTKMSKLAGSK